MKSAFQNLDEGCSLLLFDIGFCYKELCRCHILVNVAISKSFSAYI
jgi:hypothetical protein